ncbi:MAG: dienelactone hydrolase family protein [Acidiferrobacterales bacterium]
MIIATKLSTSLLMLFLAVSFARAEIQTQAVRYNDGDVKLHGYFAWDDAIEGKRPGILVVHEGWGLNQYVRKRAEMLAKLGYLAFAIDMYGQGKITEHANQASEWMKQITNNVGLWQQRALLGLDIMRTHELVDKTRTAAIGYCFGGATVMQLAYAGAALDGVVSFHGSLPVATPEQAENVRARVLIAHGSADAFIPPERIVKFQSALDAAGADWEMITYGGARHGFTNPDADVYEIDNVRYNKAADARSWRDMQRFFKELFSSRR